MKQFICVLFKWPVAERTFTHEGFTNQLLIHDFFPRCPVACGTVQTALNVTVCPRQWVGVRDVDTFGYQLCVQSEGLRKTSVRIFKQRTSGHEDRGQHCSKVQGTCVTFASSYCDYLLAGCLLKTLSIFQIIIH
jgi:hypothetical protein